MTLPPVIIELPASDASSPYLGALVESCAAAVSDGECRVGAVEGVLPRAIAIVSWEKDRTRARLEIGVRKGDGSRWITRDVEFREADPESERWRSLGLMIGTLVGESEREAATEAQPPASASLARPAPVAPAPRAIASRPSPQPRRVWIGIEALLGSALDRGGLRYGAGLHAVWDTAWEPVLLGASARWSERAEDDAGLRVRWLTFSIGAGARASPLERLRLEGRIDGVVEQTRASVGDEHGAAWTLGVRGVGLVGVEPKDGIMVFTGGELTGFARGTQLRVRDADAGRAPALTWTGELGIRAGF